MIACSVVIWTCGSGCRPSSILAELVRIHGEVLPAGALRQGFEYQGQRVPLKGMQGIFKPAVLPELPHSITTAPPGSQSPGAV